MLHDPHCILHATHPWRTHHPTHTLHDPHAITPFSYLTTPPLPPLPPLPLPPDPHLKCHSTRQVTLVPSTHWPGEGMLGVKVRFDSYMNAEESLCRILAVETNSPAELAGLRPGTDFLLGTATQVFSNTQVLAETLAEHVEEPVEFYVYDSTADTVRVAVVMPSDDWGGDGLLGADAAHGYLHRLPSECCETTGKSVLSAEVSVSSSSIATATDTGTGTGTGTLGTAGCSVAATEVMRGRGGD
jgi:hypothetical protein